jgi:hypothetical protein
MENFPGWTVAFELLYRQEQSRHASGRTRVKDFGTPIWTATYQSRQMRPNEVDEWRARLNRLQNGLETFRAWPTSRCWPISDPNGTVLNGGGGVGPSLYLDFTTDFAYTLAPTPPGVFTVGSVGSDNKSLAVTGLPSMFKWSVGDYLQIGQRLHQVTEVLSGGFIRVAPHFSVGILVGQTVVVHRPSVDMTLVPGSVSTTTGLNGRGTVSFQAIEARG